MVWPGTVAGGGEESPESRAASGAGAGGIPPPFSSRIGIRLLYRFSDPPPTSRLTSGPGKAILSLAVNPSHTIEIRVRFGETDPYGVAYFAAILDYFKRGLDEFLRARGLSPDEVFRNRKRNIGFPVVATQCRYRSPVRFDDLLTLRARLVRIEEKGATFGFSLFRTVAGKDVLAAEGKISCRAIDGSWKSIPVPRDLRKALSGRPG